MSRNKSIIFRNYLLIQRWGKVRGGRVKARKSNILSDCCSTRSRRHQLKSKLCETKQQMVRVCYEWIDSLASSDVQAWMLRTVCPRLKTVSSSSSPVSVHLAHMNHGSWGDVTTKDWWLWPKGHSVCVCVCLRVKSPTQFYQDERSWSWLMVGGGFWVVFMAPEQLHH